MTAPGSEQVKTSKILRRSLSALLVAGIVLALFIWLEPEDLYLWIKALHVIAVISWMAGLLYLPRLFIYHTDTEPQSESSELFKIMEQRLYRFIMNPAMMISWAAGLYLAWSGFAFQGGWLHVKLLAVELLTGAHIYLGRAVRAFGIGERPSNSRAWRFINEVPTLLMIVIVAMVIIKPF